MSDNEKWRFVLKVTAANDPALGTANSRYLPKGPAPLRALLRDGDVDGDVDGGAHDAAPGEGRQTLRKRVGTAA